MSNLNLESWILDNRLRIEKIVDGVYKDKDKTYVFIDIKKDYEYSILRSEGSLIEMKEDMLFDPEDTANLCLLLSEEEEYLLNKHNTSHYLFIFGERVFTHPINKDHLISKPAILKYTEQIDPEIELDYVHLGIRGGYELLNGSGGYKDFVNKAKFFNHPSLGICERNTLAGTLPFQIACKSKGIKSILGETVSIKRKDDTLIECKLYVTSDKGWNNLLHINKYINVDNVENKYTPESILFERTEGLICIISTETKLSKQLIQSYKKQKFVSVYYQISVLEYLTENKDKEYLLCIKDYLDNFIDLIEPVFINDSFYVDKEYSHVKKIINNIGSVRAYQAKNQHYKSVDEIFEEFNVFFTEDRVFGKSEKTFIELFTECCVNTINIQDTCNFEIETKKLKLPTYNFTFKEKTGKALLIYLINEAFEKLKQNRLDIDIKVYEERIKTELTVIEKGGFIDYFLTLWDIFAWCKESNILTGIGRGSAGGSLVAFLLDITRVNPIDFGLLFERFLNEGRMQSLPDIDSDIPTSRRDDVKRYIEQRFGTSNVCSVGTYTTFKLKAALKDLGRAKGIDHLKINYINSCIEDREEWNWFDIFSYAKQNPTVKKFIQDNFDLINDIDIVLNQPRSSSIHAAAMIITPEIDDRGNKMTIFDWLPIKMIDGVLVSEWEGSYLDKAGFLKEDILGIQQLDKFKSIIDLIKQTTGDEIDIYNLPYDDIKTFSLFKKGYSEDVFHFGAAGLRGYVKEVGPDNIEDLIAINALYRPGPIGANAHNQFTLIKHGKREPEYDYLLEGVTKSTNGLYIYQEQIMATFRIIADLTLTEADNVRRSIGKKIKEELDSYRELFINKAIEKSYSETDAKNLWKKLEDFSSYGFNRSHAASYSITGYVSQWLKANYPLQFYTIALQYSDDKKITGRMVEINKAGNGVKLLPPDINKSTTNFELDLKLNTIYWSLDKVSFMGEKGLQHILKDRQLGGQYFAFEEFYKRTKSQACNSRLIKNLILSGAFDEIENIEFPHQRYRLIEQLYSYRNKEEALTDDFNVLDLKKDYYWTMMQKLVCGYGNFSFEKIIKDSPIFSVDKKIRHVNSQYFESEDCINKDVVVGGILINFVIRKTKNGNMGVLELLNGGDIINITIWPDYWEQVNKKISESKGKIIFFKGVIKYDSFKKRNTLYSSDKSKIDVL